MHRAIYDALLAEIESRAFKPGDRIPSEALLCERFGASRITVARAIQTLQREGRVTRRAGSGTYVEALQQDVRQFGLLIPDLGRTEIFGPICRGMVLAMRGKPYSLAWGFEGDSSEPTLDLAEQLCQQYIAQGAAGIFFAPFAHHADSHQVNVRIAEALRRANMPTVLLDRGIEPFPALDIFDRVSIDHYTPGNTLARHVLPQGSRHIVFLSRPYPASSVEARFAGYAAALNALGSEHGSHFSAQHRSLEQGQVDMLSTLLAETGADALLCANDVTATTTMQMLHSLGLSVPGDIRVVGIDDVRYAEYLPVPLTTLRQDCVELGAMAMALMLDRIERPLAAPKKVHVNFELVVRTSCGAPSRTAE